MTSAAAKPTETFLAELLPLATSGQWDTVRTECMARTQRMGEDTTVLYVQGLAAFARNDLAEAAQAACRALAITPQFAESADLVAITHGLAGDINTALYFAKLAVTLPTRDDLHAFHPNDFPTFADVLAAVEENRLVNRAKVFMGMGRIEMADNFLRQHLSFFPEDENAMLLVMLCLSSRGDHFGAADWLRGSLHRRPESATLLSALGNELSNIGAFEDARAVHQRAAALSPDDAVICARQIVDLADSPAGSPDQIRRLAQQWAGRFASGADAEAEAVTECPALLNVGVVLSDLPGTAAGSFLAEMLSRANPSEFRLIGYGFGSLTEIENLAFQQAVSEWYDLTELDAETIGDMFRAEDLDMVINTSGFVSPLALAALGSRCAPRQVLWRNAPYGAGLATIDGQLSDATLDAAPDGLPVGSRTVTLRHGSVLAQLPSTDAPLFGRAERSRIHFGADVTLRQLTAETAAWWAELLLAVPESMLVLNDTSLSQPKAVDRLTVLFGNYGLAHRITMISAADDADFWAQADIALLPARAASAQRAVETLWGGIPVLVPELPERGTRAPSSLLRHAGLEELVAGSMAEFARKGSEWAQDSERRNTFRESIRGRLSSSPVFDPEARAQDLWQACRQLYQ